MWKDFKQFIVRGNVVGLAIAVLIGTSFGAVVTALTKDMITPLISVITGNRTNFNNYAFTFHHAIFLYGAVVNAAVSFILIALVVFFLIVKPATSLATFSKRNKQIDPTEKQCPECLSSVPVKATRCAFCTTKLKTT